MAKIGGLPEFTALVIQVYYVLLSHCKWLNMIATYLSPAYKED